MMDRNTIRIGWSTVGISSTILDFLLFWKPVKVSVKGWKVHSLKIFCPPRNAALLANEVL